MHRKYWRNQILHANNNGTDTRRTTSDPPSWTTMLLLVSNISMHDSNSLSKSIAFTPMITRVVIYWSIYSWGRWGYALSFSSHRLVFFVFISCLIDQWLRHFNSFDKQRKSLMITQSLNYWVLQDGRWVFFVPTLYLLILNISLNYHTHPVGLKTYAIYTKWYQ